MSLHSGKMGVAILSLSALGLFAFPMAASAQDDTTDKTSAIDNKIVTLNLESADLYVAFKALFQQAKVDYTLDPNLKGTLVSVNIRQPFKNAIDLLIKTSGLPISLSVDGNVYSIVPRQEEKPIDPVGTDLPENDTTKNNDRITRIYVSSLNGIDIVSALGGRFLPFTGSFSMVGSNPFGGGGGMGGGMGGMGGGMGGMGGGMGGMGGGMGGMGGGMGGMGGGMGGMGGGMGGMGGGMGGMGGGMGGGFGGRGR